MRKLASFVTIKEVIPMEGKDRIVDVTFEELGFECIIPKEDAIVGNKIAFIQEGSILPVEPKWEFLRKRCYSEAANGFIIKPMTMGKKIDGTRVRSWGLGVSVKDLGFNEKTLAKLMKDEDGDALTEALKIRKYEPEEDASPTTSKKAYPCLVKFCLSHALTRWIGRIWQKAHTNKSSGFPSFYIDKSDETSIQNYKAAIEKFAESPVYATVKMEGQSFTCMLDPADKKHRFFVCSRNIAYRKEVNNDFWNAAKHYDIERGLRRLLKEDGVFYILQGEQCGPNIQSNIYKFKAPTWLVFAVKAYDPYKKECVQVGWDKLVEIVDRLGNGLRTVPYVGHYDKFSDIAPNIDELVAFAEKSYWKRVGDVLIFNYVPQPNEKLWTDYAMNEGIVIRTDAYDKSKGIGLSTKVKNLPYQEIGLGKIAAINWK